MRQILPKVSSTLEQWECDRKYISHVTVGRRLQETVCLENNKTFLSFFFLFNAAVSNIIATSLVGVLPILILAFNVWCSEWWLLCRLCNSHVEWLLGTKCSSHFVAHLRATSWWYTLEIFKSKCRFNASLILGSVSHLERRRRFSLACRGLVTEKYPNCLSYLTFKRSEKSNLPITEAIPKLMAVSSDLSQTSYLILS